MTVLQAIERVLAAAKGVAPLVPDVLPAVTALGGDFAEHRGALTELVDAVQLAEKIIKDATGL